MHISEKRSAFAYGFLALLIMAFIFTRSLKPAELSGAESEAVMGFLRQILSLFIRLPEEQDDYLVRKIAHFCEFAALGFSVKGLFTSVGAMRGQTLRSLPLLFCLLTAISDEMLQTLIPGRSCEVRDVVIDFCGSLCGVGVMLLAQYLRKKRLMRKSRC